MKGSFDNWAQEHVMELAASEPFLVYAFPAMIESVVQSRDLAIPVFYKFIVDGVWQLDQLDKSKMVVVDDQGNANHVVNVKKANGVIGDSAIEIDGDVVLVQPPPALPLKNEVAVELPEPLPVVDSNPAIELESKPSVRFVSKTPQRYVPH